MGKSQLQVFGTYNPMELHERITISRGGGGGGGDIPCYIGRFVHTCTSVRDQLTPSSWKQATEMGMS